MARVSVKELVKTYRRYGPGRNRTWRTLLTRGLGALAPGERTLALDGISFDLGPGESLGVIGRNGAGKSTLLRLVGGVGVPDAGTIELEGRVGSLLELGAGMHPDLTGRDNAILACMIGGLSRREAERRLAEIAAFAELEQFMDAPLRSYSSGMQMRLGFAVSVHLDPEVLLVDEVLSVGDLPFQRKCSEHIERLQAAGCAILFATHDLGQASRVCDRILWLEQGRGVAMGEPESVVTSFREAMADRTRRLTPSPASEGSRGPRLPGLELGRNRLGSQEVRIEAVRLLGPSGDPVESVRAGDGLRVEIAYSAEKPTDHPIVGVSVSDDAGRVCVEVSTEEGAGLGPAVHGSGQIVLELFRLDLRPGRYFVDVGIYEQAWQYSYDYHWHAYSLTVEAGNARSGQHRSAPHRWSAARED